MRCADNTVSLVDKPAMGKRSARDSEPAQSDPEVEMESVAKTPLRKKVKKDNKEDAFLKEVAKVAKSFATKLGVPGEIVLAQKWLTRNTLAADLHKESVVLGLRVLVAANGANVVEKGGKKMNLAEADGVVVFLAEAFGITGLRMLEKVYRDVPRNSPTLHAKFFVLHLPLNAAKAITLPKGFWMVTSDVAVQFLSLDPATVSPLPPLWLELRGVPHQVNSVGTFVKAIHVRNTVREGYSISGRVSVQGTPTDIWYAAVDVEEPDDEDGERENLLSSFVSNGYGFTSVTEGPFTVDVLVASECRYCGEVGHSHHACSHYAALRSGVIPAIKWFSEMQARVAEIQPNAEAGPSTQQ
ncbi:hypothetical protein F5878DRAFT_647936, partial [Lentinula raphanica]